MSVEKALADLRSEPVPPVAADQAVIAVRSSSTLRPRKRYARLLVTVGAGTLVVAVALWPWKQEDRVWASALQALKGAKAIHIRFVKKLETVEAWRKNVKARTVGTQSEARYNGEVLTERLGLVSSVKRVKMDPARTFGGMLDLAAFAVCENKISGKAVPPVNQVLKGKSYRTYTFRFGEEYDGEILTTHANDLYPNNHHVASQYLTAYVDPSSERIVRIDKTTKADPLLPKTYNLYTYDNFVALVDYPPDLADSMFDPPADTFDYMESKKQVASLLAGSLRTANLGRNHITLKALLCDGLRLIPVWTGCPGEYNGPNRFKVEGMTLGHADDIRAFTSLKCKRAPSAACPYSLMAQTIYKMPPKHVKLTLPMFAPDKTKRYLSKDGKVLGYHSKMVGEATFNDVPVTETKPLADFYEREFGLLNNFW